MHYELINRFNGLEGHSLDRNCFVALLAVNVLLFVYGTPLEGLDIHNRTELLCHLFDLSLNLVMFCSN